VQLALSSAKHDLLSEGERLAATTFIEHVRRVLLFPNLSLYDAAKEACHYVGMPWTDPRTGVEYPPPPKGKR
jgi:hypothetical protein